MGASSSASSGSSAGFSVSARALLNSLRIMNTTSDMRRKSITTATKLPKPMVMASCTTAPSLTTSGRTSRFSALMSRVPNSQLINGMNRSFTRLVVILPNAVATITPTAISMTLPRMMNSLNSLINFFIPILLFNSDFAPYLYVYCVNPVSKMPIKQLQRASNARPYGHSRNIKPYS